MQLYTAAQAASQIDKPKSSVIRAANRLGISKSPLGFLLTAAQIAEIAAEIKPIGCPNMTAGNDLWRRRKKRKKSRQKRQ